MKDTQIALSNTQADPVLQDFAARINTAHAACEGAFKAGLLQAREAGELLLQAKELVAHGAWLPWLEANCTVSERTAQGYMRVARRWVELEAKAPRAADLSVREAIALLSAPRSEPTPGNQVPMALAYYYETGLVCSDAVHELLTIADDFGPEVRTDLPLGELDPPATEADLSDFLNEIRPLESPGLWPVLPLGSGATVVLAATRVLFEDARQREAKLPQWEVIAFWFASVMVLWAHYGEPFAQRLAGILARHVGIWRESFRTALAWMTLSRTGTTPPAEVRSAYDREREAIWWGMYADLRHAGVWEAVQVLERNPEVFPALAAAQLQGLLSMDKQGSYVMPSVMQARWWQFEDDDSE
jgi:hypothetical protein